MSASVSWRIVMVYGSFNDPTTGKNFFLLRYPEGRVPWSRKIAPAINKIVRAMFTKAEIADDLNLKRSGREPHIFWNVDGGEDGCWDIKQAVTRYEWNGTELTKV